MVDMRLPVGELQPCLYELLHAEEALFVGIDAFLELEDVLLGGEEAS